MDRKDDVTRAAILIFRKTAFVSEHDDASLDSDSAVVSGLAIAQF